MNKGSTKRLNELTGVTESLSLSNKQINDISRPLGENILFYNKDTQEIKISNGVDLPKNTPDHKHPYTYAPIAHSHMFGANDPWLMVNPRLWWRNDVPNHPELVILDGSEIPEEAAENLSQVYPGVKLLTHPITSSSGNGFENDDLILSVTQFHGFNIPARMFGDELSISNFSNIDDQWLTGVTDLDTPQEIIIEFKKGYAYRPTQYIIIPAGGTAEKILEERPTPKNFTLEGSNDGETWVILDTREVTDWETCSPKIFDVPDHEVMEDYKYLRINITSWNECENTNLFGGIRRLWIFGRKAHTFALPKLDCDNPDFCWVVPIHNLNVGLIHENIGDIGFTAVAKSLIPTYRLVANGRALKILDEENQALYAVIGHQYDRSNIDFSWQDQEGNTLENNQFHPEITNINEATYFELILSDPTLCIGGYRFDITDKRIPKSWIIEIFDGVSWHVMQQVDECPESDFRTKDGEFYLDTNMEEITVEKIRINILGWHEENEIEGPLENIGIDGMTLYTHPKGYFYIPDMTDGNNDSIPYIVRNLTATDVSPSVISRLQQNIVDLAQSQISLINRVNKLDPDIIENEENGGE